MDRSRAIPYVSFVVDDAGSGREVGTDPHAIIRDAGDKFRYGSWLIGWQCGFEPLFVAVHSYLDVAIEAEEAEELAVDFLRERGWFSGRSTEADYAICPEGGE